MAPNMPCPSAEILRRSLDPDDPMTGPERQLIEAHVERCDEGCKEVIEALLRGNTLAAGPEATRPVEAAGAPAPRRPAPSFSRYENPGGNGPGGQGGVVQGRPRQP